MSQRVADEIENRRGLVLGLTLAELLLLLLFVLLLALGWRMSALQKDADIERSRAQSLNLKMQVMETAQESLAPLLTELKLKGRLDVITAQNLVTKLGHVEQLERELKNLKYSNAELMAEYMGLKATTADSKKIETFNEAVTAASQIDPNDPPAVLERAVEVLKRLGPNIKPEQIKSLSEMTEARANLQAKLEAIEKERDKYKGQVTKLPRNGNGLTYRSCWETPEQKPEYMFDITIRDDGLLVTDATLGRANDPQMKLLGTFDRGVVIGEDVFQQATTKAYLWSKDEKCRFYTIIRDDTGPTSKQRYKELRKLVEGHFYPLLLPLASVAPKQHRLPTEQDAAIGGPYVPAPGYKANQ